MFKPNELALLRQRSDAVACHESVDWSAAHLADVCKQRGISVYESERLEDVTGQRLCIMIAGPEFAHTAAKAERAVIPDEAESFCLFAHETNGQRLLVASGPDVRGLVYAVLEAADIIKHAADPIAELARIERREEKPAAPVRGINRLFVSENEDKPWFYNRQFWADYLNELATHRFNRLHLALGMGYDWGHDQGVQDNYFCFAYPFLLTLPGYHVSVKGLPPGEAERNLEMIRFISRETKRRGLHFQLGLWTHAYGSVESPEMKYPIEGIHPGNHAAYCRDAVRALLEACRDIDGVTVRTHYESGIPEPAEQFWNEVFTGIAQCGRTIELDLHSKGLDDFRLQAAIDTGLPVTVSPKYWAEHMGLPYHQAAIRQSELPVDSTDRPDMVITVTSRRFTRYGYADFMKEDRRYNLLFRIWPGTQRVLLWGDPVMAAGYGKLGTFCGSGGVELCEPLSFKGRKGSGTPGGRDPYVDPNLRLDGEEWKKYSYSYRLWGRLLYNPETDSDAWMRYLKAEFGAGAEACGQALAYASRILPLMTTSHLPSAANNVYWPEMYANMPIVRGERKTAYDFDTPEPKTFGAVSPADPALFYRIDDYAEDLLRGSLSGKMSPIAVADRLNDLAGKAERFLAEAESSVKDAESASFRRWSVDVAALAGLGRFFAGKLRAGVAYALFERTGDKERLREAIHCYRAARHAWIGVAQTTLNVYREDITFGYVPHMRGHWAARLSSIEDDIAALELLLDTAEFGDATGGMESASAISATGRMEDSIGGPLLSHASPNGFLKGETIRLTAVIDDSSRDYSVMLHYRHANQLESYSQTPMRRDGGLYSAMIPGAYTDSPYPLVYYFEIKDDAGHAWQSPGFDDTLSNQPYYVLRLAPC